ncbi:MAG: SRPBCC family protein [Acidobacteria bacterium]|nr:SRPBCC family protein [Acidobacteriota bacterium]
MPDIKPLVEQPDSWIEDAPVRVRAERTVSATPAQLWAVIADHESWPRWFDSVKKVEVTGVSDAVDGTRRVTVGPVVLEERFTRWEPEHVFAFAVTGMSHRLVKSLNERLTLTAQESGTTVVYEQAFDPKPVAGLFLKIAKGKLEGTLGDAIDKLAAEASSNG